MATSEIEADTGVGDLRAARSTFHELRVARVESLCDDAAAVTFDVPDDLREAFSFDAGQSLTLRRVIDGREERRSYSICAPVGTPPRIGVREIPGGLFSSWLVRELQRGDVVEAQVPSGSFGAGAATGGRHLCIAAGSGITPMLSIASTVMTDPSASVTLIYGNRSSDSVMFAEELADLKDRHPVRFALVHVLSREPRVVDLFSGRIDADRLRRLLTALVPLDAVDHVWVCGPFGLIADARRVLDELSVRRDKVHVELFYVDEPPPEVKRPQAGSAGLDADVAMVTISLDGRTSTTAIPKDRTILDAAATTRNDLPFACKGGVCGTCRALVPSGGVDMRRNYALDDDEVARGFVLTCQTYPVGDEIEVDFDA